MWHERPCLVVTILNQAVASNRFNDTSTAVVLNLGVIGHFSRGRERYLVFVKYPLVADSDVVNVFSGNDGTIPEEFIALRNDSTAENVFKEMLLPAYWSAMVASYSKSGKHSGSSFFIDLAV